MAAESYQALLRGVSTGMMHCQGEVLHALTRVHQLSMLVSIT